MSDESETFTDKQDVLILASQNLAAQVARLTRALAEQSTQVDNLRSELNRKPDDSELKFVADFASVERKRHVKTLTLTAVGCAVVALLSSVLVSHSFATAQIDDRNRASHEVCIAANHRIDEIAGAFTDTANEIVSQDVKVQEFKAHLLDRAGNINSTRQDCDRLYPVK